VPTDPRKRQKKQERRAAKRKAKHHALVRLKSAGLAERLADAAASPVLASWITEDLWTQGLGWACLSRELPSGQVAFGLFLVDRYCLGVKNAMADVVGRFTYDSEIERKTRSGLTVKDMSPADVRKLIEEAVEYAAALGLAPHPDYQKARHIFGAIDPSESREVFEFGKDGRPFFFAGPNDTPERCRRILATLEQVCGPGGYDFMIPFAEPGEVLPESFQVDERRAVSPDPGRIMSDRQIGHSKHQDQDRRGS
jgi:hypothetical protein